MKTVALALVLITSVAACSITPLEPWDRDLLAKPEMSLTNPMDDAFDSHIYFSKEASSGGPGFAGGGCGCN